MPKKSRNKTVRFWDMLARQTDKVASTNKQSYHNAIEKTKMHLHPEDTVLDFGCGTGLVSLEVADQVTRIEAIDISGKMIELAQRKAQNLNITNIRFTQATIFDPSLLSATYDVVLSYNILHLLPSADKAISRIGELLKPGGLYISSTRCEGEARYSVLNILIGLISKIGIIPYFRFFTIEELDSLITSGNLQIISAESIDKKSHSNRFIVAKKI